MTGHRVPKLNIMSGCALWECFQMRLAFVSVDSKVDCLPQRGCGSSYLLSPWTEQKVEEGWISFPFFPCLTAWAGKSYLIFSCPQTGIYNIGSPGSQAFGQGLNCTLASLSLQLADGRSRQCWASITTRAIPHKSLLYMCYRSVTLEINIDEEINTTVVASGWTGAKNKYLP